MLDSLLEMFGPYFLAIFVAIIVISGVDFIFNSADQITYWMVVKLNTLNAFLSFIIMILVFMVLFNALHLSEKVVNRSAMIITFVLVYLEKSYLVYSYGLRFESDFLVILAGVLILTVPYYLLYRTLKNYGKGFLH